MNRYVYVCAMLSCFVSCLYASQALQLATLEPTAVDQQRLAKVLAQGIDKVDKHGRTPLMQAARNNQPTFVLLLLRENASTAGVTAEGKTFFDYVDRYRAVARAVEQYKQELAAEEDASRKRLAALGFIMPTYRDTSEHKTNE